MDAILIHMEKFPQEIHCEIQGRRTKIDLGEAIYWLLMLLLGSQTSVVVIEWSGVEPGLLPKIITLSLSWGGLLLLLLYLDATKQGRAKIRGNTESQTAVAEQKSPVIKYDGVAAVTTHLDEWGNRILTGVDGNTARNLQVHTAKITAEIRNLDRTYETIVEAVQEGTVRSTSVAKDSTSQIIEKIDSVQGAVEASQYHMSSVIEFEPSEAPTGYLTKYEQEAIQLLVDGCTMQQASGKLGIKDYALRSRLEDARKRTDTETTTELAAWAIVHGQVSYSAKTRGNPSPVHAHPTLAGGQSSQTQS